MFPSFAASCTKLPDARTAADALAEPLEAELGGPESIAGGCLWSTAATGGQAIQIGQRLGDRWPMADLIGTSFEGLIAEGQVWRDHPGLILLAWRESEISPLPFMIEPDEPDLERIADEVLDAFPAGTRGAGGDGLLLFFPDAEMTPSLESRLPALTDRLASASVAGAAAAGPAGEPAAAWVSDESLPGSCPGLFFPNPAVAREAAARSGAGTASSPRASKARGRVGVAEGSRLASPWLRVTKSRPRWIDEIDGRPALNVLRETLGLSSRRGLEGLLDRLLVRFRGRAEAASGSAGEERYIVGLDPQRSAFSLPIEVEQGGDLAFAWPDAALARESLRETLEALSPSALQLQFACRARDRALHGDDDLEPAWIAAHAATIASKSRVVGTVGPFQLAQGGIRRVHSTVLVSLSED